MCAPTSCGWPGLRMTARFSPRWLALIPLCPLQHYVSYDYLAGWVWFHELAHSDAASEDATYLRSRSGSPANGCTGIVCSRRTHEALLTRRCPPPLPFYSPASQPRALLITQRRLLAPCPSFQPHSSFSSRLPTSAPGQRWKRHLARPQHGPEPARSTVRGWVPPPGCQPEAAPSPQLRASHPPCPTRA